MTARLSSLSKRASSRPTAADITEAAAARAEETEETITIILQTARPPLPQESREAIPRVLSTEKSKSIIIKNNILLYNKSTPFCGVLFTCSAPSGRMFQRVKVPNPPDSGKDIAKSKGVSGNWESEGSWRQITGLTNRNHEGCICG